MTTSVLPTYAVKCSLWHSEVIGNSSVKYLASLLRQASIEETAALRERAHGLAAQLEGTAREAREATEALRAREAALDAAQRTAAERKRAADEEADRLARERVKRQRLEEDVKVGAMAGC